MRKGLSIGTLLLALALPAGAQQAVPDAMTITAVNVTARDSERAGGNDAPTLPGDVLEYTLEFTNVQDGVISNVVLDDPIPSGTVIVLGSATASRGDVVIDYSIDGGQTYAPRPVIEEVIDGQNVERPAPDTAYTHIRWTVTGDVNPGAQVTARFRAVVAGGDR